MTATTLFKPCGVGNFEWLQLSAAQQPEQTAFAVGDAERLLDEAAMGAMVLIAPADKISFRGVEFEASERKLLRQTVPYSLEEDLVDDVDELHFALGEVADHSVDVAIVERNLIEQWQDELTEQHLDVQAVVCELQLLPLQENAWSLLVTDQQWLIRYGASQGFAMEPAMANVYLQLLLDESITLPERLLVYADSQPVDQAHVLNQLPEMLRGIVEWQPDDYWSMVATGFKQNSRPINLLQGDFALGLPWKKWWKTWRLPAIILVAAVVINILMTFMRIQVLENRNIELRTETEQIYRSVVPRGAVMQPAKQLRRKVDALRSTGGEGFVSLFERVAKILVGVKGLELQSINYNAKQSELRLTLLADGFNDVETVRANLEAEGLSAQLTGSNAEGSKTRARLRISN